MSNIFSYNGPIYKFLSLIADLVFLNLLWVVSCLPIVNSKQPVPMWLIVLIVGALLVLEGILCYTYTFGGKDIAVALLCICSISYLGIISFLFPIQAQFVNRLSKTFFNAMGFAVVNWNTTIKLILLHAIPIVWFVLDAASFERFIIFWFLIGVAAIEYLCVVLILPTFKPFLPDVDIADTDSITKTNQ